MITIHIVGSSVPSPTNLTLEQNNETSINASWSPPPQSANITGYRVFWTNCTSSNCINQTVINSSTVEKLTGLMAGQCYSLSVVSVSDLPSNIATRNITLGNVFLVAKSFCLTKLYFLFLKLPIQVISALMWYLLAMVSH